MFAVDNLFFLHQTDGYVEFEAHCRTSCPTNFQTVGNVCEECSDFCDKGETWMSVIATLEVYFLCSL